MKKYKQKPKIVVSQKVKNKLDKIGKKGDTYESVVDMLINEHMERK